MSEVQWFYEAGGTRVGPVSDEEMKNLVRANTVGFGTAVWRQGFADWVRCEQSELKEQMTATPPPLKKEALSDVWLWLLTLVPLQAIVAEPILYIQPRLLSLLMASILFTSIIFCALDIREVRRAGYKAPSIWWLVFTPIYLFKRSRAVKAEQWPFIVSIALIFWPPFLFV